MLIKRDTSRHRLATPSDHKFRTKLSSKHRILCALTYIKVRYKAKCFNRETLNNFMDECL